MTRKTTMLLAGGAIAAVAVLGTALGAGAAEVRSAWLGAGQSSTSPSSAAPPSAAPPGTPDSGSPVPLVPSATSVPSVTGDSTPLGSTRIPSGRATEIALAETGGGRIVEVEWELEHGRMVWGVEIVKDGVEIEVEVDAGTGQVVRTGREPADDHRHDDD